MKLKNLSDKFGLAAEIRNATKMAKRIGISHNTAYTFLTDRVAEKKHLYMNTFALIMIDGLGITKEKFLNMKIGDLFTIE